mgnify:CR=1 FL=1
MDFSFTDNEKLVIKKTKSILNFCFSKKFFGTSKGPIRRVPERPGVHLEVVCMSLQCLVGPVSIISSPHYEANFSFVSS